MSSTQTKREEQTKLEIAKRFFQDYDTTHILGNVDFSVAVPVNEGQASLFEMEYLLWAEAKRGTLHHIEHSLVQLIITIGKARTYLEHLPPAFLGAFDEEKIAFIPYYKVADIFTTNDFNWNVAPSDHKTKEFDYVLQKVSDILKAETLTYRYDSDEKELRKFIKDNFIIGKSDLSKVRINKNNFTAIYQKWRTEVMPSINVNWEEAKKQGVIAADFYLADILSEHNSTLLHRLYVLLRSNHYEFARRTDETTLFNYQLTADFKDNQEAHRRFWNRYERPPRREYWDYIVERRDLLVPQDVRERKGSFFTPQRWVELSQKYLADELGEDWQDHYYIWDCCAGTGNLLAGLTNKYNIYASTLDQQDVDVMRERIQHMNNESRDGNGSNLLENHVFQFDFLNDPLLHERDKKGRITKRSKLPDSLQDIITDPEKRKHLVIYINPPYAEGDNRKGEGRSGVAVSTVQEKYADFMGYGKREMYIQFMTRIYNEIPTSVLANFSKLKNLQAPKFNVFRSHFRAKLGRFFLVPGNTFDNVDGDFPIAFYIWHTSIQEKANQWEADAFNENGEFLSQKTLFPYDGLNVINDWTLTFIDKNDLSMGTIIGIGNDFQNQRTVRIERPNRPWNHQYQWQITKNNILQSSIYLAVRHCIEATWINDRDQFLYPNDGWQTDYEFQTDSLIYTLFHGQNRISSTHGTNHWIPFSEQEVEAQERFDSHFMHDYLSHPVMTYHDNSQTPQIPLFDKLKTNQNNPSPYIPIEHLSMEAKAVLDAGRELWRYYHKQPDANPNASFYDIRLHFQGTKTTAKGKEQMNPDSPDTTYTALLTGLRQAMKKLAAHIEPKVYEYGFLK